VRTVTACERLEGEEVPSSWGRDSRAWESGDAQPSKHEAKHGFMLEERCGLKGDHGKPCTNLDYRDSTPVVCVVIGRLIQCDDEQTLVLERRVLNQRIQVRLQPIIRHSQIADARIIARHALLNGSSSLLW